MFGNTKLVVFEGNDLAGKSTSAKRMAEDLRELGVKAKSYEWKGTTLGTAIEGVYTSNGMATLEANVLSLFGAWFELLHRIREDIESEDLEYVILDRYYYSTYVYQCVALNERMENANAIAFFEYLYKYLPEPSVVIYLDLNRPTQLNRLASKPRLDAIEERLLTDAQLYCKINDQYSSSFIHHSKSTRIERVDAALRPEEVAMRSLRAIGRSEADIAKIY